MQPWIGLSVVLELSSLPEKADQGDSRRL